MVKTEELEILIKESGLKRSFISAELGISVQTLSNKIKNKTEFKAMEINKLCEMLKIMSTEEKVYIFLSEM